MNHSTLTPNPKQLARALAQADYLRTAIELMEAHPTYAPVIMKSALSYIETMRAAERKKISMPDIGRYYARIFATDQEARPC